MKWCGHDSRGRTIPHDDIPTVSTRFRVLALGQHEEQDRLGFVVMRNRVNENVFIPKYYDPDIVKSLEAMVNTHDLVAVGDLVKRRVLQIRTGHEVGKLAYGTGPIPFVRTSDLSNWELKTDPKQNVSAERYNSLAAKQDVKSGDILMVRDGTYLIGTTAMLTQADERILYQSHLYKIRVLKPELFSPYLLLALLNTPIVKRQIRSKQFTQDIIDTLGQRIQELMLPVPKDAQVRKRIIEEVKYIVETRAILRQRAQNVGTLATGIAAAEEMALADIL